MLKSLLNGSRFLVLAAVLGALGGATPRLLASVEFTPHGVVIASDRPVKPRSTLVDAVGMNGVASRMRQTVESVFQRIESD